MDQATPRFSIDNSMNLEAMAPVEQVNESPKAPMTEKSVTSNELITNDPKTRQ